MIIIKIIYLPRSEKRYEHKPELMAESDKVKILRDFKLQTDKVYVTASQPSI